ncbi:hypothetical protein M9Y10_042777 [Tritrichomonas musculus]|uniref:Calponin-homology (CH) domain-containing protein n=1 Tax=Tritrichomonas musculus TaxID=1915356 RepID=A0ABR2JXT4_9EUKA
MTTEVPQSEDWVQLQVNVFTRWVQNQLKSNSNIHIDTITKDLSNGVALVELAKTLTHKDTPRTWTESPKRTVDMVQNCDLAIDMFSKDGVNLVGISGKDVNDNNEKLILGLVWSLILHYSIGKLSHLNLDSSKQNSSEDIKNAVKNETRMLKSWAIERTENYPNVHNFSPYELSMCALLDSYVPNKINYYSLNPQDTDHNANLATNVMNELGIPIFIYPEDVKSHSSQVDDKTLLTQLSSMKTVLEEQTTAMAAGNGEKSDIESDSEGVPAATTTDDFSNKIFEENDFDQESMIKADSLESSDTNGNQHQHDDWAAKLFEDYEFENDSIIGFDSANSPKYNNNHQFDDFVFDLSDNKSQIKGVQVHPQPEIRPNFITSVPNGLSNHLNDELLDRNSNLKVDSREEEMEVTGNQYQKLQPERKGFSFFRWLIDNVFKPIESLFKQPENQHPYARVMYLNSPITPYYYYVDYNRM